MSSEPPALVKSPLDVVSENFNEARKMLRVGIAETKGFKPIGQEDDDGDDDFLQEVVSAVDDQDDEASLQALGIETGT